TARALTGSRAFRSAVGLAVLAMLAVTGFFAGWVGATAFPQTLEVAAVDSVPSTEPASAAAALAGRGAVAAEGGGAVGGPENVSFEPYAGRPLKAPGLSGRADRRHDPLASRPSMRPVLGGWVTSGYGHREDPFTGQRSRHFGLDFAGIENSAILAA